MPQYFTYLQDANSQRGPNKEVRYAPGRGYYLAPNAPATVAQATANTQAAAPPAAPPAASQEAAPVAQALSQTSPFETDPGYLASLAAQQAGSQRLDDALRAAREQAIVAFGNPGLAIPGYQVDPTTAAYAQANTAAGNSTLAQLQRTRDQNQQSIVNNLAAHGLVRSGDLGYKTGQNQQDYGTALYNASNQVLTALAGDAQDNLTQKQNLQSNANTALTTAYSNFIANPALWGAATGGTAAALNANATANTSPAPIASALTSRPPVSRLAARPPGYGGRATAGQVGRNSY